MNWAVQLFGSAGLAAIVLAVINAIVTKRKTDAETGQLSASATQVITDAASGVVKDIRVDNERLREENASMRRSERILEARVDDLEDELAELRREREEWRRVLIVHGAWDALAIAAVREAIPPIDLPDVPPLTPPVQARPSRRVSLLGDDGPVGP